MLRRGLPPSTKSRRINFCSSVEHNLVHFSGLTRRLLIVKSRMKIILKIFLLLDWLVDVC